MAENGIKLSRPLATHKGELKEIIFREPTARDFIAVNKGPYRITRVGTGDNVGISVATDWQAVFEWASRLSDIEVGILETLNSKDTKALVTKIGEIVGADEEGDTDTTVKN